MPPPARPARRLLLIAAWLLGSAVARADVGGTLSVQTDARERGVSYSANRPSAQLAIAWDGDAGWYAGAQLGHARFTQREGAMLQLYAGRVVALTPGLDAELGLTARSFENVAQYDYQEVYLGLLGNGWTLRAHLSPDYYGIGQRSLYLSLGGRWPLGGSTAAVAHLGALRGWGGRPPSVYGGARSATRADLQLGLSWQLGGGTELQAAWVAAGRGGPYVWTDATRRRTAVLNLTSAF